MNAKPPQPPEGRALEAARKGRVPKMSQRDAAERAGISEGRWRQIVAGYQVTSAGEYAAVHAPADTLARMARAVGVAAADMSAAGRKDAADQMDALALADARSRAGERAEPPSADLVRKRLYAARIAIDQAMAVLDQIEER